MVVRGMRVKMSTWLVYLMRRIVGSGHVPGVRPGNSAGAGDVREQQRCGRKQAYAHSESGHVGNIRLLRVAVNLWVTGYVGKLRGV